MNAAAILDNDLWGDTPVAEQSYWTVRYFNPSGFGVEQEWINVYVADEAAARAYAQMNYRIAQSLMYRVVAFKQAARIF